MREKFQAEVERMRKFQRAFAGGGSAALQGDDLYGNGLSRVKERLEREGLTHPNQKVKDFSVEMIRNLEIDIAASAERNKQRLDEERQEFEETRLA